MYWEEKLVNNIVVKSYRIMTLARDSLDPSSGDHPIMRRVEAGRGVLQLSLPHSGDSSPNMGYLKLNVS